MQLIVYNLIRGTDAVWATWFFLFGWVGFALVMFYNCGWMALGCINLYVQCKFTNRELMDESRRDYYFRKLNSLE